MRKVGAVWPAFLVLLVVAGCGLQPTPPPQFDMVDFGGTGDLMARCMQYASQSYCERQIWGGDGGFH